MGRPEKLTPEVQERLVQAVRAGNFYEAACGYARITYRSFRNWMVQGEASKSGKYFQLFQAVTQAELEAEARMVSQWQAHMPSDYRAIRDFLERRHSKRWSKVEKHELSGKDGEAIQVKYNTDNLSVEELETLEKILSAASTTDGGKE